jgi:DNA polymerase kappa
VKEYDPDFSSHSLDEIYFDLSNAVESHIQSSSLSRREVAEAMLHEIRSKVVTATGGLTCSAGLANNFLLAKICAGLLLLSYFVCLIVNQHVVL